MRHAHVIMSKWLSPRASLKSFQQPHGEKDRKEGGRGGGGGKDTCRKNKRTTECAETFFGTRGRVEQMKKVVERHLIRLM